MSKAIVIQEREFERVYSLENGMIITLKLKNDLSQITFWEGDKQLGKDEDFCFDDSNDKIDGYLLKRMYVPIKGCGLGRAALQLFKDYSHSKIYVRPNDGFTRDDGSHLTEDAPGFVHRMQKEGLIENDELDDLEESNWNMQE